MNNLTKLLKDVLEKAGLKTNPEMIAFLADNAAAFDALEVPTVPFNLIQESVFGKDQAKNNADLKNHFIGQFGAGIETDVFDTLKGLQFTEDEIATVKATSNSTGKRISKAFEIFSSKYEEAKKGSGKGHSEEFVKKIQEKELELTAYKTQAEQEKAQLLAENSRTVENLWRRSNLSSIKWNPAIPEVARVASYETGLNEKLEKLGGKLIFDAKTLTAKIVQAKDETLPLMNGANEFGFSDLHGLVLQDYKLLDEGTGGSPENQRTPFTVPDKKDGGTPQMANFAKAEIAEGLAALQEMAKNQ
jgi:hypothetical protein